MLITDSELLPLPIISLYPAANVMEGSVQDTVHPSQSNGPQVPGEPNKKQPRRKPRRQARDIVVNQGTSSQTRPPRRRPPISEARNSSEQAVSGTGPPEQVRNSRGRRQPPTSNGHGEIVPAPPKREGGRRAKFGAGLTQPESSPSTPTASNKLQEHQRAKLLPEGDDLASSLIRNLSTPPYPDCPICFSAIRPDQAIWSCSPSLPIITSSEAQVQQYCWTSFHVRCIRSWAEKSVKEVADAWRARGDMDKKGDWRCPGCQAKREAIPSGYWCVPINFLLKLILIYS